MPATARDQARRFQVQVEPDPCVEGAWVATFAEVPSVYAVGSTEEEAHRKAVAQLYEELDPKLQDKWDEEDSQASSANEPTEDADTLYARLGL